MSKPLSAKLRSFAPRPEGDELQESGHSTAVGF